MYTAESVKKGRFCLARLSWFPSEVHIKNLNICWMDCSDICTDVPDKSYWLCDSLACPLGPPRFTCVVLSETSRHLLDGSPWHLVLDCNNFGDPLTFHLGPPSGQNCGLLSTLSNSHRFEWAPSLHLVSNSSIQIYAEIPVSNCSG